MEGLALILEDDGLLLARVIEDDRGRLARVDGIPLRMAAVLVVVGLDEPARSAA